MMTKQMNKVRAMTGVRPGIGSAGRANAATRAAEAPTKVSFADVGRACDRWLRKHDLHYRQQRQYIDGQNAARKARRGREAADRARGGQS